MCTFIGNSALSRGGMEEIEVVVGTYSCMIHGFAIDFLNPEAKGLRPKFHAQDHTGCVRTVAAGRYHMATGSTDESIRLYDMRTHREIGTLAHHEGAINCLVFYNNTHLFSASDDRTICIWECDTWDCVHQLTGHKAPVTCFAVHPSGKIGLSVSLDKTLRTWNLMTGAISFTQKLGQVAQLVQWNLTGDHYAVAFEKSIAIYEATGGTVVCTISVDRRICCILYLQDNVLAVGSDHPFIQVFSTEEGKCICKLEGHSNRVKALAMAPGGLLLFSASSDGCVKCWRLVEDWDKVTCISTAETSSHLMSLAIVSPESLCSSELQMDAEQGTLKEQGQGALKEQGQGALEEQGQGTLKEQGQGALEGHSRPGPTKQSHNDVKHKKRFKRKTKPGSSRVSISSLKRLRKLRRKLAKPAEG